MNHHDEVSPRDKAEALLRVFCTQYALEFPEALLIYLRVDASRVALEFDPELKNLFITVPLGEPSGDTLSVFTELLHANLFRHATYGAVFCLDSTSGQVVLQASLSPSEMTSDILKTRIEYCVHAAEIWQNRLSAMPQDETAPQITMHMLRV